MKQSVSSIIHGEKKVSIGTCIRQKNSCWNGMRWPRLETWEFCGRGQEADLAGLSQLPEGRARIAILR